MELITCANRVMTFSMEAVQLGVVLLRIFTGRVNIHDIYLLAELISMTFMFCETQMKFDMIF